MAEQKLLQKKGASLPADDVMQWIHDVAEGLEYAARHGIIHHDVKPGNIMLDADGNAKIGDFGIACRQQSGEMPMKEAYGSPLYVSPEKVSSGMEDSSGDIYSLGAAFYHLLTGVPPFQHENLEELLWSRVKQNPVPPHQLRPGISPLISSLIMRMMHQKPEMRPSYPEIIRNLNAVLHNTDSSSLVMRREMPLPKGAGDGKSPNSTSSLRVKSPSVMLKRRRSSITRVPAESAKDFSSLNLEKQSDVSTLQSTPRKRLNPLLLILIVLAAFVAGFIIFSAIQLILAGGVSPETVFSVPSAE